MREFRIGEEQGEEKGEVLFGVAVMMDDIYRIGRTICRLRR